MVGFGIADASVAEYLAGFNSTVCFHRSPSLVKLRLNSSLPTLNNRFFPLGRRRRHRRAMFLSLIHVKKLVGAEQSLTEISEGLEFGRRFPGRIGLFALLRFLVLRFPVRLPRRMLHVVRLP